jgi:hypothetical protein
VSDVVADTPADTPTPPRPKRQWIVVCEVEGKNPGLVAKAKQALTGRNEGGVIVRLGDNDGRTEEVARVGFMRRNTSNPDDQFKPALGRVLQIANDAAVALNDQERLIAELLAETKPEELT